MPLSRHLPVAIFICMSLVMPGLVVAQPQGTGDDEGEHAFGHGLNVFFSPAGEPFRAEPGAPYPIKLWFDGADLNHDGKIDADEFMKDADRFFSRLDADHNGVISSPENTRYEQYIAPEILNYDPRLGGPNVGKRQAEHDPGEPEAPSSYASTRLNQGAGQYSLISEPQPIRACDSNLDFKVTLKEWDEANRQRFGLLDRNKDGGLTLDELPVTPAARAINSELKEPEKAGKDKKRGHMW